MSRSPILSTERGQAAQSDPMFPVQSGQDKIPVPQQQPEKYIALYDFKPECHVEIEIKAGHLVTVLERHNDWFYGEANGKYGFFPRSYVRKAGNPDGSPIQSTEQKQAAHPDPVLHVQSDQDMKPEPQQPEKYTALYDYEPSMHNDIGIKAGEVVMVWDKYKNGWFFAEASGRRGLIPGKYVQKEVEDNTSRRFPYK
ncbi:growth factor receptor-bound protein 2-like [Ruditapes philippinarum]|uniref:growth factor receptor-bound protein 2-like n=1 Tax=Ruditapes philippinarum TaxID=129788 RepID=UPI00295B8BCF|nr:growth factor receptor-bound protein 2-like [Ruditapes philippinarum]